MKHVDSITDRAKRYRANARHPVGKRCQCTRTSHGHGSVCGSRENLGVGHRDGDESNGRDSNLFTVCKRCNALQAVADKKAGRGVRTRQYNPDEIVKKEKYFLRSAWRGLPTKLIPVEFADDASRAFSAVRDTHRFGASDMKPGSGDILNQDGKLIGRISYNGRIWKKNPGAINLAQYVQAAMEHVRGAHDAGGKVLHDTPKSVRQAFAKEIWWRRGYRGQNPPADIMPEFWVGKLRDSHGRKVTSEAQAKAILLSELRALGKIPPRKNPSDADELNRKFHGRGPDRTYSLTVPEIDPYSSHPELAQLGILTRLIVGEGVLKLGGQYGDQVLEVEDGYWCDVIEFCDYAKYIKWLENSNPPVSEAKQFLRQSKCPDVAAEPNAKQLYIVGGNQNLDAKLEALGVDPGKEIADLGFCYLIDYFTQKRFDRFEPTNYFHHFGEKTHTYPRLVYWREAKMLQLVGGEYFVTSRGIEN